MVFVIDRFRTIHAIDVPLELMPLAPENFQSLPLMGPKLLAVRPFKSEMEKADATIAALQGLHLGARPDLWMPYDMALSQILDEAKPVAELLSKRSDEASTIKAAIRRSGVLDTEILYLPVMGRQVFWTVLVHGYTGYPVAYLPIDPY